MEFAYLTRDRREATSHVIAILICIRDTELSTYVYKSKWVLES